MTMFRIDFKSDAEYSQDEVKGLQEQFTDFIREFDGDSLPESVQIVTLDEANEAEQMRIAVLEMLESSEFRSIVTVKIPGADGTFDVMLTEDSDNDDES